VIIQNDPLPHYKTASDPVPHYKTASDPVTLVKFVTAWLSVVYKETR